MKCEFCGTENTADTKFCMQCGKEILTEESLEEKADDMPTLLPRRCPNSAYSA